ncbi:MAG: 1-acyl-sn-glycerol-3-phosphate acyltransferase [Actinomycetota bacterium]|nr:1-acyl-sn-glycerol-3-phosphate acyltransferase [Actinomycetota bacterium]
MKVGIQRPPGRVRDVSRNMSPRYRLFRRVMRALGWFLFGFTVHGAERVPKEGPLILASNHHNYADPVLVCMAVPRRMQWMAKKEVFVPPFDKFFYFIGSFPVDRNKGGRTALKTSLELLAEGWTLGIFPEGTRRKAGLPEDAPKHGVAMLAARGGAPILPVFVSAIPSPLQRLRGKRLQILIGHPVTIDNTKNGKQVRAEVAGEVLREIYALGKGSGAL